MNTSRFAGLGRRGRDPALSAHADDVAPKRSPTDEEPETKPDEVETPPDDEEEPDDMTDTPEKKTDADAIDVNSASYKAGMAAANERVKTVFASDEAKGHEARAAKMLTTSMAADEIVGLLADEKPGGAADDDDKSQGREMLDQMKQQGNRDLANKDDVEPATTRAKAASVWDRARTANTKA